MESRGRTGRSESCAAMRMQIPGWDKSNKGRIGSAISWRERDKFGESPRWNREVPLKSPFMRNAPPRWGLGQNVQRSALRAFAASGEVCVGAACSFPSCRQQTSMDREIMGLSRSNVSVRLVRLRERGWRCENNCGFCTDPMPSSGWGSTMIIFQLRDSSLSGRWYFKWRISCRSLSSRHSGIVTG